MSAKTAELVKKSKKFGGPSEPITLNIANRLFAQKDYDFRRGFPVAGETKLRRSI